MYQLLPCRAFAVPALAAVLSFTLLPAQDTPAPDPWSEETFEGLALRAIGPALMSGRIADIAIHPRDDNLWYVAVGSGGVWKTTNAGVTWTPVFDDQPSYSIGCVTVDPHDPHTVWVGTGENVGGRHVGFGDGVYKSDDGGAHWRRVGLPASEHIAEIIVHPRDPGVVWVAAQGPLWSAGGERGVYKSTDGGATWRQTLGDGEWTGATDLAIDPRDPDRLYAATWQRHRTVAAYLGGGPGSGIHRSDDGGETWTELTEGLPETEMGKIGLAISPQRPDVVYAAIELDRRSGGVWRSTDRGATWEQRSDAVSGGTGPHYYQELYASPHAFDRLYLCDVRIQVSDDGGKTFRKLEERHKHSDNHAIAFRAIDDDYLLVGTDGGLYESFDLAESWRFVANLPVTQFYKIALDDAEPFYHVYGGTQDNATQGGPVRTDHLAGIRNADWRVVLDWDGHQPATEPGNPDILYAERQEGFLARIDLRTGEVVGIQPQPEAGEPFERYNWDAPILVSPHAPARIYFASQRVWRSDDRGDSWIAVSTDLTRHEERIALPIMGAPQSWDGAWDFSAMSTYGTITSIAESPRQEGLLYAGTDDGLLQVSEDGGGSWRRIEVGSLPGVPPRAFVNDVRADLHDAGTVYVALDDHKNGDYRPFLLMSTDRGRSWSSIAGNLPDRSLVWRLVQDHVRRDLLFAGTESGAWFSVDRGARWTRLGGGMPTIPVRDLHIHRRESDLVCATFGRGIRVLDDMSVLRAVSADLLAGDATLFAPRDAHWYVERSVLGFGPGRNGDQGAGYFTAPNPPFGAVFTYWLGADLRSRAETRKEAEKAARAAGAGVAFPGWDEVEAERRELAPRVWLTVHDAVGRVVRRIEGPAERGFHRVAWDLRHPAPDAVTLEAPAESEGDWPPRGLLAAPGSYTVSLALERDGAVTVLGGPQPFEVVPLRRGSLEGATPAAVAAFWREYEDARRAHSALRLELAGLLKKTDRLQVVLANAPLAIDSALHARATALRAALLELDRALGGDRSKQAVGEKDRPTVESRLFAVELGVAGATYGPTPTHRRQLDIAREELGGLRTAVVERGRELAALATDLVAAGAPALEGEALPGGRR